MLAPEQKRKTEEAMDAFFSEEHDPIPPHLIRTVDHSWYKVFAQPSDIAGGKGFVSKLPWREALKAWWWNLPLWNLRRAIKAFWSAFNS
jgi:hypothetical protein